ncbi:MAG: NAD(P)-binding domain-containing protein [Anaerotardibacter sp.]
MTNSSFVFVGDTSVGAPLVSLLLQSGFEGADSLETADVVFTYHESQTSLEDIYYEEPGLLSVAKQGACLIDLSPSTPSFARELYAIATVSGKSFADAPLSVRDMTEEQAFASASNLVCFVGAEKDTFKAIEPMLNALSYHVSWMGAVGQGQAAKAALTIQVASDLVSVAESYQMYCSGAGAEEYEDYLDLMDSLGMLSSSQLLFAEAMREKRFEGSFTVEILMGELFAAFACAEETQSQLLQADAAFHMFELLAVIGGSQLNPSALCLLFSDEEETRKYNLNWSLADNHYAHHECDCDDDCDCGHEGHHHSCSCKKHSHDTEGYGEYDEFDDYDDFDSFDFGQDEYRSYDDEEY